MSTNSDKLDELRAALKADAAGVAEALLGAPNKARSTRDTWRWGRKGSLAVVVRGPRRGLWYTHEGTEGSDLLGLTRYAKGCNFPDAVRWASDRTGIVIEAAANNDAQSEQRQAQEADRRARQAERAAREAEETAAEQAQRIDVAQRIAAATVPASGTLADYYLKQVRGIAPGPHGWPEAGIRFHPSYRALVVIATASNGDVRAVQRVHLSSDGAKVDEAEVERRGLRAAKVTNGVRANAVVRLPGDPTAPLLLAEGPETSLACWSSTGFETWIALGGVGGVDLPLGRKVVVVSDDNPPAHDAKGPS